VEFSQYFVNIIYFFKIPCNEPMSKAALLLRILDVIFFWQWIEFFSLLAEK